MPPSQFDKDMDNYLRAIDEIGRLGWLRKPFAEFTVDVRGEVSPYPAAPAGSTYRRTRQLQRNWYDKVSDTVAEVGNRAPYAGYVHGAGTQAWFHTRTGWKLFEVGVSKALTNLNKSASRLFERIVRKYANG